jgi:hypothetical protein
MNWKLPRRQFLATAGTAAAATLIGESVFPLKSTLAATPLVRRSCTGRVPQSDQGDAGDAEQ